MAVLKYKNKDGEYVDIPTLVGPPGPAGTKYTAGTNIEITDDDVINNTIPMMPIVNDDLKITTSTVNMSTNRTTVFGALAYALNGDSVTIGARAAVTADSGIAIGYNSRVKPGHYGSIAIGDSAETTKKHQMMIGGSGNGAINEVNIYTQNGVKTLATTEDIASAIGDLDTILTALDTGEGVE